jgi:hypothetical protein
MQPDRYGARRRPFSSGASRVRPRSQVGFAVFRDLSDAAMLKRNGKVANRDDQLNLFDFARTRERENPCDAI